jgi:hypothetical protein
MRVRGDSHDTTQSSCSASTTVPTKKPQQPQPLLAAAAMVPLRRLAFETCLCIALWCVVVSMFVSSESPAPGRTLQAPLLRLSSSSVSPKDDGMIIPPVNKSIPLRYLVHHKDGAGGGPLTNRDNTSKKSKDTIRRILRFLNDEN